MRCHHYPLAAKRPLNGRFRSAQVTQILQHEAEVINTRSHRRVIGAAGEIIRGKGATNYAVGLATARIVEAVLRDQRQVLPVSSLLDGQAGIGDVCLSLPSVVGRLGVDTVLPGPLSEDEAEGLRRSADTVRGVIRSLGL